MYPTQLYRPGSLPWRVRPSWPPTSSPAWLPPAAPHESNHHELRDVRADRPVPRSGCSSGSSHPHPWCRTAPSFRRWSFRASWRARARACFSPKPVQPFVGIGVSEFAPAAVESFMLEITLSNGIRNASSVELGTSRLHARENALRRTAVSKQSIEHNQAPRPGDVRPSVGPSDPSVQRNSCSWGRRSRHPMHVRTGVTTSWFGR